MSTETVSVPFKSTRKSKKTSKKALTSPKAAGAESFEDAKEQNFEDASSEGMLSPTAEAGLPAFNKHMEVPEEDVSGTIRAHNPLASADVPATMDINSPRIATKAPVTDLPAPPAPVAAPQNTVQPSNEKLAEVRPDDRPFSPKKGFLASMKSGGMEGADKSNFGTPKTSATPSTTSSRSMARFGTFFNKASGSMSSHLARTPSGAGKFGNTIDAVQKPGSSQASHAWHDLSPGPNPPELVNVVIETPAGSKVKYALDPDTGMVMVDRVLHSSMLFPANYGFVPQSLSIGNGGPMEVLLLNQKPCQPLSYVRARPVGVLALRDTEGKPVRKVVVAVHQDDPVFAEVTDLSGLSDHRLEEIKIFFQDSEWFGEQEYVRMDGDYANADNAKHYVEQSCRRYINAYCAGANAVPLDEDIDMPPVKPGAAAAAVQQEKKSAAKKPGFFARLFGCGGP